MKLVKRGTEQREKSKAMEREREKKEDPFKVWYGLKGEELPGYW